LSGYSRDAAPGWSPVAPERRIGDVIQRLPRYSAFHAERIDATDSQIFLVLPDPT